MKRLLAVAVSACFAYGTAQAQTDRTTSTTTFQQDNTSNLQADNCPDYFDVDWGLTHDRTDPCWNAYLVSVGYENLPNQVRADLRNDEIEELERIEVVREPIRTERTVRMRNIYGLQFKEDDTSQLRWEPCPDYFDSDWGMVNNPGDPCWNAYITAVGIENVPRAVRERARAAEAEADVQVDRDTLLVETERRPTSTTVTERTTTVEEECVEEDLSNQAVSNNAYQQALNQRQSDRAIADRFDPNAGTAKSVDQLRDSNIEAVHLDATFAALDDDRTGAINKVEALGVRGLADEFDRIDLNGDGVVSEGEFNLYFDGRLADNEALCLDGERITSVSQVETRVNFD